MIICLVVNWFSKGYLIGTGESALPFYTTNHNVLVTQHSWSPAILGIPSSFTVAYYPYFLLINKLTLITHNQVLVQALVFFFFLSVGVMSVYFGTKKMLKESADTTSFIAATFYLFNCITLVAVLNRLQYPLMFLFAAAPLGLYIFIAGINKGNLLYVLLLNIALVFFSTAFALLPALLLFWILVGSYVIFYTVIQWPNKRKIAHAWLFCVASLIVWLLLNSWWTLQFFKVLTTNTYITTQAYAAYGNTKSFITLSEKLGNLSYIFRLMHNEFFIEMQKVWGEIYFTPLFIVLSYIIPFLAFFPLLIKNKPKIIYYFLGLALTIIFFSKGSAGPFGEVFYFLFTHIRVLESFRNPFEKIAIILPLAYAPLIGFSVLHIYTWIKRTRENTNWSKGVIPLCIVIMIVLTFPMLNRWVFTSSSPPANNVNIGYYVEVPGYYKQANRWLNSQKDEFRTISLPINGEGVNYKWQYGYGGVEFSNGIFEKPFISLSTTIQFLNDITVEIQKLVQKDPNQLYKAMNLLNARYIMIHHDLDRQARKTRDPAEIEKIMSQNPRFISPSEKFDKLSFFAIDPAQRNPQIYASNEVIQTSDTNTHLYADLLSYADYAPQSVFIDQQHAISNQNIDQFTKQWLIQGYIVQNNKLDISAENALNELPTVRILPTSKAYVLIQIKEAIEQAVTQGDDKEFYKLNLTSKRLVEIQRLISLNAPENSVHKLVERYIDTLGKVNPGLLMNDTLAKQIIMRQFYVLQGISNGNSSDKYNLSKAIAFIDKLSKESEIRTIYPALEHTYRFKIHEAGTYQIILNTENMRNYYVLPSMLNYYVDGQKQSVPFEEKKELVLSFFDLAEGEHEISFEKFEPKNLIYIPFEGSTLESGKTGEDYKYEINFFDNTSEYLVNTDYRLIQGEMPILNFVQDVDYQDQTHWTPLFYKELPEQEKFFDWQTYTKIISPEMTAKTASIIFSVDPWNNCERYTKKIIFFSKCSKKEYRQLYNQKTEVELRDTRVEKIFNQALIVRKQYAQGAPENIPTITFTKINNAKHQVYVKNATAPYLLIFSEGFNPLWEASIDDSLISEKDHMLVNNYANAWLINKEGDYTIDLSFKAEESLSLGKQITTVTLIIIIIVLLFKYRDFKKNG